MSLWAVEDINDAYAHLQSIYEALKEVPLIDFWFFTKDDLEELFADLVVKVAHKGQFLLIHSLGAGLRNAYEEYCRTHPSRQLEKKKM